GTLELHPEPTDLAALVRDVAAAFGAVAGREGVGIEVTARDDAVAEVDPVRIRQVIDNLVANAVRYAPSGSAVTLEVREAPDGIGVAVVDRGPGIPPDLLPHLFDRFRKSDESRGSGLGLAIAKELVEAHGGAIHVESTVGLGARFEVTLPRDR
ncbi:MAG: HAMP domain-containing histidine kinase, partial [Dehalococcoidia bacterium]|nr:HAMP domain-containing histidine kinase [Dehalococcoidia bacterium]